MHAYEDSPFDFQSLPPEPVEETVSYDMPSATEAYAAPSAPSVKHGGVVWLITGLLVGMLVAVLTVLLFTENHETHHLKVAVQHVQPQAAVTDQAVLAAQSHQPVTAKTLTSGQKPSYAFYQSLPKKRAKARHVSKHQARPLGANERYMLQVASVPHYAEADQLKARLALMGYAVATQKVKVNHHTWHRVRVGPYRNRHDAKLASARLHRNHINAMMLRTKNIRS